MSAAPALVLMYHHVASPCADPSALAVSPTNFAEHLQVLKRVAKPRSLQALTDRLFNRSLEAHTVTVTFDDGYRHRTGKLSVGTRSRPARPPLLPGMLSDGTRR